jgi:hypothetical protein
MLSVYLVIYIQKHINSIIYNSIIYLAGHRMLKRKQPGQCVRQGLIPAKNLASAFEETVPGKRVHYIDPLIEALHKLRLQFTNDPLKIGDENSEQDGHRCSYSNCCECDLMEAGLLNPCRVNPSTFFG